MPAKKDENGTPVAAARVVWQLSNDGLVPSKTPYGFMARNPLSRIIQPGQKLLIDLQVQANVPLLVFPARSHADDVTVPAIVLHPGTPLTCFVENKSQHSQLVIEDKEALVALYPLTWDGVGEVG